MEPNKGFEWSICGIVVSLMVAGASLYIASTFVPEWTDAELANQLSISDLSKDEWSAAMRNVRTNKWPLFDAGTSLMALGASLCLAVLILDVRTWHDLGLLSTPRSRLSVLGLFAFSWIGNAAELIVYVLQKTERIETYGDAVGIPLSAIGALFVAGLCVFTPIVALTAALSQPDKSLWLWPSRAQIWTWLATLAAALFVAAGAWALYDGLIAGPFIGVPVSLIWIYTALVLRAAALSGIGAA